jgi:hypothetical protein
MLGMKRTVIVCAVLASALVGAYHVVADAGSCPDPAAAASAPACASASVLAGPPPPPATGGAVCADNPSSASCSPEECNRRCGPVCGPSACDGC